MPHYPPSRQVPRLRIPSLLIAAALVLTACGGGGGSAPAASAPVAVQAPAIATQPASQAVTAGQSATFTVAATGDGLSYQWQRDGKDIAGATGASYTLASVQASDNGSSFTVVVKNAGGSVTSAAASLKVTAVSATGMLSLLAGPLAGSDGNAGGKLNGSVDGNGTAARFLGSTAGWPASSLYVNAQGEVFVADGSQVRRISPAGDVSTLALPATGAGNWPITYYTTGYGGGDLLAFDYGVVNRVDANGKVRFLAGQPRPATAYPTLTDGVGANASFGGPQGFVPDGLGNVYVRDQYPPRYFDDPVQTFAIRKIGADGTVITLPVANLPVIRSWFVDRDNRLVMATDHGAVLRLEADYSLTTLRPAPGGTSYPSGSHTVVAGDRDGNLYVADYISGALQGTAGSVLHKITPAGVDTVIAGTAVSSQVVLGRTPGSLDEVQSLAVGVDGTVYIMNGYSVLRLTQ